jgi:hypothetical protein
MYNDVFHSKEQRRSWLENLHNESPGNKLCVPNVFGAIKMEENDRGVPTALSGQPNEL